MSAIFSKEMRSYFMTPLGYVFLAFMLVILGIYFFIYCLLYQEGDYSQVLNAVTLLVLFGLPLLTMRIFSEEAKNKTDQLLLTAPISTTKIVLGKFFAAITLYTIALVISMSQPLMLAAMGTELPTAKIIGGYIGFFLYGCAFISIGMLISSLTENQLVSAIITIAVFMCIFMLSGIAGVLPSTELFAMLMVIVAILIVAFLLYRALKNIYVTGIIAVVLIAAAVVLYFVIPSVYANLLVNVSEWISLAARYSDFYTGVFDLSNVVFYLSFTVLILFVTAKMVEKRRWN